MAFSVTKAVRAERRKRAEARQAEYDKLTLQQKLDKLPANGAKKQRAKLEAAIAAAQAKKETATAADKAVQNKKSNKEGK